MEHEGLDGVILSSRKHRRGTSISTPLPPSPGFRIQLIRRFRATLSFQLPMPFEAMSFRGFNSVEEKTRKNKIKKGYGFQIRKETR